MDAKDSADAVGRNTVVLTALLAGTSVDGSRKSEVLRMLRGSDGLVFNCIRVCCNSANENIICPSDLIVFYTSDALGQHTTNHCAL